MFSLPRLTRGQKFLWALGLSFLPIWAFSQDWERILPKEPAKEAPKVTESPKSKYKHGEWPDGKPKWKVSYSGIKDYGRHFFFNPQLSTNGKVSCGTCHPPEHGYASMAKGLDGLPLERKAPCLFNRAYGKSFFWDGRAATLEEQVVGPLTNPNEMGKQTMDELIARLQDDYPGITKDSLIKVLVMFMEEDIVHFDGPFDSFIAGENKRNLMTEAQVRGFNLFRGKAHCYKCHTVNGAKSIFSDEKFHNTGVGVVVDDRSETFKDLGRYAITGREVDRAAFKTPGLRGCKFTAPYMHDGSLKTLEDVVDFYIRGGIKNGFLDKEMKPVRLSPQEKRDLVEFLKAL